MCVEAGAVRRTIRPYEVAHIGTYALARLSTGAAHIAGYALARLAWSLGGKGEEVEWLGRLAASGIDPEDAHGSVVAQYEISHRGSTWFLDRIGSRNPARAVVHRLDDVEALIEVAYQRRIGRWRGTDEVLTRKYEASKCRGSRR